MYSIYDNIVVMSHTYTKPMLKAHFPKPALIITNENYLFDAYSARANVEWTLDRYTDVVTLRNAIENIVHLGGDTNIADGLRVMRQQVFNGIRGDRVDVKNIGIVITDGNANTEADQVC